MKEEIKQKLNITIDKYLKGSYSEKDFHENLSSLSLGITELELLNLREFLEVIEGQLERIDFLVDEKEKPKKYRQVIVELKLFLEHL